MPARLFIQHRGPWRTVLAAHNAPGYHVALSLDCGHMASRLRRPRGYLRTRCGMCRVEAAPHPAPRQIIPVVRPAIRPDIHERFLAIVKRVDAQLSADLAAARRLRFQEDAGVELEEAVS